MARYSIERGLSQRRAAWLCSTPRSAIHYRSKREQRDRRLSSALRIVARNDPSWGYRLAGGYLRLRGWQANDKRVYRLWRLNGLCLPPYRPSRKIRTGTRLDGLALRRNDVWAWDFVHDRYHDSEPLRCLTVKDEATGYCLAIKTDRHLGFYPAIADTSEKADNGRGGVSCQEEEHTRRSSNVKQLPWRISLV